jgi:ABC-2 type transport system permease protein
VPIHDQGYRRFAGGREGKGLAWLVIARAGIRTMIRKRLFLGLLLVAYGPFLVRCVQLYISANFAQAAFFAPTAQTFREFLEQQSTFVFFITIFVGAGLISNDRRANALQIYLSKPLTRMEYVSGKAATLAVFLLAATWVPALLLLLLQIMFAGSFAFVQKNAFLFPAITVYSFLQVILATLSMLALSSMSKSPRFVGIMYAGVIFFTDAIFGMLKYVVRVSSASVVSPTQSLAQIGDVIFRVPPRHETPVLMSLSLIVERRIRGVEVVA